MTNPTAQAPKTHRGREPIADHQSSPQPASDAQCGRADLVRALAHADPATLEVVAERLGFTQGLTFDVESNMPSPIVSAEMVLDGDVGAGKTAQPDIEETALAPTPFWQPDTLTDAQHEAPETLDDGPLTLPDWPERPKQLARAWPLAPWSELLPRFRGTLVEPTATHALDLPSIVRRLFGLAAATLRLEPGLLRELRLLIGAAAAAESELWQDGSVTCSEPQSSPAQTAIIRTEPHCPPLRGGSLGERVKPGDRAM